jgi:hypothetical protein
MCVESQKIIILPKVNDNTHTDTQTTTHHTDTHANTHTHTQNLFSYLSYLVSLHIITENFKL